MLSCVAVSGVRRTRRPDAVTRTGPSGSLAPCDAVFAAGAAGAAVVAAGAAVVAAGITGAAAAPSPAGVVDPPCSSETTAWTKALPNVAWRNATISRCANGNLRNSAARSSGLRRPPPISVRTAAVGDCPPCSPVAVVVAASRVAPALS
jgi:hypothetical protein